MDEDWESDVSGASFVLLLMYGELCAAFKVIYNFLLACSDFVHDWQ